MKKFQHKYLSYTKKSSESQASFEQRLMNDINYWANVGWYVVSHTITSLITGEEKHHFVLGFEIVDETPIPTSV